MSTISFTSRVRRRLAGTLQVTLLDGYVPQPEDMIVAVTAASLSGKFSNATDRLFVSGGAFDVTYTDTSVVLSGFDPGAASPTPSPTVPRWHRHAHGEPERQPDVTPHDHADSVGHGDASTRRRRSRRRRRQR